jgi:hypothetical protein
MKGTQDTGVPPKSDTNDDGVITVSDLTARIDHVREGARWSELMQWLAEAG